MYGIHQHAVDVDKGSSTEDLAALRFVDNLSAPQHLSICYIGQESNLTVDGPHAASMGLLLSGQAPARSIYSVAFTSCLDLLQVLADVAAADAFAAKGASDIDARQMQATLRSLVEDAVKNSAAQSGTSPPASAQQAMLRYALARHGAATKCCMTP